MSVPGGRSLLGFARVRLSRQPGGMAVFTGPAVGIRRTSWHVLIIRARRQPLSWIAALALKLSRTGRPPWELAVVRPFGWNLFGIKLGVFFLREGVGQLTVQLYGISDMPGTVGVVLLPIPRLIAAAGVFWQNPETFCVSLRAVSGTWPERLRKAMAAAGLHGQEMPRSYADWLRMFDSWPVERMRALLDAVPAPDRVLVSALVFHSGAASSPALAATLASLQDQECPACLIVVAGPDDADAVGRAAAAASYVAVLQAGEVVPRHGLLLMALALRTLDGPEILLADEDRILSDGDRADPLFKPQPNLTMLCSGLLSRGLWLIRAELLAEAAPPWAECVRLQAWFRARAAGRAGETFRIPYVLTQRGAAEHAPPQALAGTINDCLSRAGIQARVAPEFPLRLRWDLGELKSRKVSLLVPSRLKGGTQLACMLNVLAETAYPNFEMLVVVTQEGPLNATQAAAARRLRLDPRVRVELLRHPTFNYSLANNVAASMTDGDFVCLLNDDISILDGEWLDWMVAHFSDPLTGIVGAKLYYPNMTTQHGGVIMGMSGMAQHVSRFLPRGEPGYAWRGVLDQELSAVTGACLLVRRSLYRQLGGLDESFPIAFNDVDFCLRARALGYAVVFAGSVELVHHETLSFGHHYGDNAAQEAMDVQRMQERWPEVCKVDPFHNPNLSLAGQSEWELAYPPRIDPDCAIEIAKLKRNAGRDLPLLN